MPLNHKRRVGETKHHRAMLELTVMGNPYPIVGPPDGPGRSPTHQSGVPPSPTGLFLRVHITACSHRPTGKSAKELGYEKVIRHFCERYRAWLGDICAAQSIRTGR